MEKQKLDGCGPTCATNRPAGDQTPPAVWFAYTPDRKGEHPQAHLSKFQGTLQADGYAGFEQIYETGRIQEAACWAHVRRKFYDIQVAHKSLVAAEALERIGALYAVESDINGRSPEERREVRNAQPFLLLDYGQNYPLVMPVNVSQWIQLCLCFALIYVIFRPLVTFLDKIFEG